MVLMVQSPMLVFFKRIFRTNEVGFTSIFYCEALGCFFYQELSIHADIPDFISILANQDCISAQNVSLSAFQAFVFMLQMYTPFSSFSQGVWY